jgi:hypothetical protein
MVLTANQQRSEVWLSSFDRPVDPKRANQAEERQSREKGLIAVEFHKKPHHPDERNQQG